MSVIRAKDLTDLRIGWQKVADRYHMTIYVFCAIDGEWQAVTNKSQGVGMLIETLDPATPAPPQYSASGRFEITRLATEIKV